MTVTVPADQPIVPVITGGDLGAYSLAREFHERTGIISAIVPTAVNRHLDGTSIAQLFPVGPMLDEDKVLADLHRVAQELGGDRRPLMFLPGYDHLVRIGIRYRDTLTGWGYRLPELSVEQFDRAALKDRFYQLCAQLSIPYPRTVTLQCTEQLAGQTSEEVGTELVPHVAEQLTGARLQFPVIVKADDGSAWADTRFEGRRKVHIAESADEVTDLLVKASGAGYRAGLIVQDYVPGEDNALRILHLFRTATGEITLAGLGEVIVEDHAPGLEGNARAILVPRHYDDAAAHQERELIAQGTKILDELDWHGFAMFDLKVNMETGQIVFLEMNPRLGRHHYYLTAAGSSPVVPLLAEFGEEQLDGNGVPPTSNDLPQRPVVSTTIPLRLVMDHAARSQQNQIRHAEASGTVVRPWAYRPDRTWKRRFYHWYRDRRSRQEVAHTPVKR